MQHSDLNEAGEVWNLAHVMFIKAQGGKAAGGEGNGGVGDSSHHMIFVADVRKLVPGELDTFLLDHVFGDSTVAPDVRSRRGATDALRKFAFALHDKPSILVDYHRLRNTVFG